MVKISLKKKLANVQKLTNKDSKKFFELINILREIEHVKDSTH